MNTINSDAVGHVDFESLYLNVRKQEGRIYSDAILLNLPNIDPKHPLSSEWRIRRESLKQLMDYISGKNKPLKILDIGCGNGWMSNALTKINNVIVYATDINRIELQQGVRVFANNQNLFFKYMDLLNESIDTKFDIILFAASSQYFQNLRELISDLLSFLKPGGEIHIKDTYFYSSNTVNAAKERTKQYYLELGYPEMSKNYFHHTLETLVGIRFRLMNKRKFPFNFIRQTKQFPWLIIS